MNDHKRALFPEGGPKPGGPYSPVIVSGGFVFVAGQVGVDPATGQLAGDTIEAQTRQTLQNIGALLKAAGCGFEDVVKASAFITQADFFPAFNAVYQEFFPEPRPARTTIVCGLPRAGLLVEVDVIARLPE
ncbi:MAG: RidA family protein [Anaerolineales bacterium]